MRPRASRARVELLDDRRQLPFIQRTAAIFIRFFEKLLNGDSHVLGRLEVCRHVALVHGLYKPIWGCHTPSTNPIASFSFTYILRHCYFHDHGLSIYLCG